MAPLSILVVRSGLNYRIVSDTCMLKTKKREEDVTATVEKLLYNEWCKPNMYTEGDNRKPYSGYVAQKMNCGWLILCEVWQDMNTGEIMRRPIKEITISEIEL